MKVTKTSISKLNATDFSNLPFGTVFSDHMLICNYKDGKWNEPEILPYGPIPMPPGAQVLHYGQSVFEGMKAFKNNSNEILLFRKEENFKRLNQSAERLSIPVIEESIFMNGLDNLLKIVFGNIYLPITALLDAAAASASVCHSWRTAVALVLAAELKNGVSVGAIE